jgi:pimeloyl-ACP methyl ester carboxylesterase
MKFRRQGAAQAPNLNRRWLARKRRAGARALQPEANLLRGVGRRLPEDFATRRAGHLAARALQVNPPPNRNAGPFAREVASGDDFRRGRVLCANPRGLHHVAYLEWGRRDNPRVVVLAHGLTHNSRVFDFLAHALARDYRVICADVVGRGASDRLSDPAGYQVQQYVSDFVTLIARLNVESLDWVGTSMGGLIGMALAAQAGSPIKRLLLNDVGPVLQRAALERIAAYVGIPIVFPDLAAAEAHIRTISAPFGNLDDAGWRHLAIHLTQARPEGGFAMNYDPNISVALRAAAAGPDLDLWPLYDAVRCPTLLLRGAESDLLGAEVAHAMTQRGPRPRLVEVPQVGHHAPMFMAEAQIHLVQDFLRETN